MQPSFRAVGQTHAKWKTFENPENERQMYGSQSTNAKDSSLASIVSSFNMAATSLSFEFSRY